MSTREETGRSETMAASAFAFFLLALATGAALRFFDLALRPLHHDEGVNALFLLDLVRRGKYRYDPTNYHGPLFYFMIAPLLKLVGEQTVLLRLWPAILGTATIAVFWPLRRLSGDWGAVAAAWLVALSPVSVYFSRDAIHESWFAAAAALVAGALVSWAGTGRRLPLVLAWTGAALLVATKETAPIVFAALAAGAVVALLAAGGRQAVSAALGALARAWPTHLWGAIAATALLVLLFTSFFTNLKGFGDMFKAYAVWTRTGTAGAGHEKSWPYFFDILWRYERVAWVLGLGGLVLAHLRREPAVALGVTAVTLLAVHAAIPYKTPWLVLGVIPFLAGSAGYLVDRTLAALPRRPVAILAGTAFAVFLYPLGRDAVRLSFSVYDDDRESVVYSQTRREFLALVGALRAAALAGPEGADTPIDVMSSDHFPLNWYTRDFSRVAFWGDPRTPRPGAIVLLTPADLESFRNSLSSEHLERRYPLRPGVDLVLLIPRELFDRAGDRIADADRFVSAVPSQLLAPLPATPLPQALPGLVARGQAGALFERPAAWTRVGRPVRIDYDHGENQEWTPPFGIEWSGYLEAPVEGLYGFALESDDGANLEIDGHLVVENWGQHAARRRNGSVRLLPGYHRLRLLYTDFGSGAKLAWFWTPPGSDESAVPENLLAHAPAELAARP